MRRAGANPLRRYRRAGGDPGTALSSAAILIHIRTAHPPASCCRRMRACPGGARLVYIAANCCRRSHHRLPRVVRGADDDGPVRAHRAGTRARLHRHGSSSPTCFRRGRTWAATPSVRSTFSPPSSANGQARASISRSTGPAFTKRCNGSTPIPTSRRYSHGIGLSENPERVPEDSSKASQLM